ncbi:MAG: histone deacetylase [Syntrophobacterales bacterium]|jgi:acetoin utilization deacetylase AcuC-like enzyme|nr:histone deacetylase [Syntrophobacterales bacterium]
MYRKTGIVKDCRFLLHGRDHLHPESPARLKAVYAMLEKDGMESRFLMIPPCCPSPAHLESVHNRSYIDRIAQTKGQLYAALDEETDATEDTFDVACLAAGSFCHAIDHVMEGKADNAFALTRPPGHHAEATAAAGFCIFNNVAIGARYALETFRLSRILIVDWDVHHGNGTQHCFYDDDRVLFFSIHQSPFYPGTGFAHETGGGSARGYTINCPLSFGADNGLYAGIFRKILVPVMRRFKPELILVSAGFDAHRDDPLGDMKLTASSYAALTRILMDEADALCRGRLVLTLEGGYNIYALADSVKAVLLELRDETHTPAEELAITAQARKEMEQIIGQLKPFWQEVLS